MESTKNINFYSHPGCPWCNQLKKLLSDHGVAYQDFNIAIDLKAIRELITKTGRIEVPFIDIDGEFIAGFDPNRIKEKLNLKSTF